MGAIQEAVWHVRDALRAADVPAAIDPADVSIPGVITYPGAVDYDRLDAGEATVEVDLVLVAGQLRGGDALGQLDSLVERVRAIFPAARFDAVTAAIQSQGADPFPALRTTVTLSVTTEEI